jgi:hypothetical protein
MFQTNVVEKIETRFMFNIFFSENRAIFLDNVETYGRAG